MRIFSTHRTLIFFLLIAAALGVYLNHSYARIYHHIGRENLAASLQSFSVPVIFNAPDTVSTPTKVTVVVLGDSLTAGVGASASDKSYPYLFAQHLAQAEAMDVLYSNLGVPGERSAGLLAHQVDEAIALHPDIITLCIGVNDMHGFVGLSTFRKNLSAILDRLSLETDAHIIVMTAPYLGSKELMRPPYRWFFDYRTRQYNEVIRSVAQEKGVILSDIYAETYSAFHADSSMYATDWFHPSDAGYQIWADALYADFSR